MRAALRSFVPLLAALILAGCAPGNSPIARPAPELPGVVLVLQGSAFNAQATREEATQVASEQTGRPARAVVKEPSLERVIQSAAGKLDRTVARAARAEARSVTCQKKGRSAATAVAEHAETILRVRLDAKTTARPATETERKDLARSGIAGVLSAVGLGDDTLYETKLDGTIERTTFPGSPTTAKQRIRWTGRRLGSKDAPPPPTVREALAKALTAMPKPGAPRWETVARNLVSGGCPVLGVAVAETFLDGPPKRRIRAAAVATLGPAPTTTPAPSEIATATPEVTPSEPRPEAVPTSAVTTSPDAGYSCTTLCTMHMVELCNNDRALWTQNGARWENTRCGVRRSEEFLASCYRMQWLSGTYEDSCIHPCESGDEGRVRLIAMLRRSGCIRADG